MARPTWMLGKEIVDATEPVSINVRQRDIDGAVALNGEKCVAGRCTLRALDANAVWFYRSKAYVQWDDQPVVVRYHLSAKLIRKVILILDDPDRSNDEIETGIYNLLPVPPGQRIGRDRTAKNPGTREKREDRGHRVMGRVSAALHA